MVVLVDWSDGTAWPLYYDHQLANGVVVAGYDSFMDKDRIFTKRFEVLTEAFVMGLTDRILIVGSAFGYLNQRFIDAGYVNVFGLDDSDDIDNRKGVEMRADVANKHIKHNIRSGGQLRARLRQQTGDDEFDWVITESMLESYTDPELSQILDACEVGLFNGTDQSHIIHIITTKEREYAGPPDDPDPYNPIFNWMTIAEWNAIRPSHSWTGPDAGWVIH